MTTEKKTRKPGQIWRRLHVKEEPTPPEPQHEPVPDETPKPEEEE